MGGAGTLIWGIVFGSVGMAYLVYGKKRQKMGAWAAGLAMCIYPFFVNSAWLTALIGLALMCVPFVYRD